MIPDPSTADAPVGEDGSGTSPTGGERHHVRSRSGHHCAACGAPIEKDVWDMTVFASPTSVAYLPCLWAGR